MSISAVTSGTKPQPIADSKTTSGPIQSSEAAQTETVASTVVQLSEASRRFDILERMKQGLPMSGEDINLVFDTLTPGTTYIMSNGSTATVADPRDEIATPISVAWAPQLFVKGDHDGNNKLSLKEFAGIVKLAGITPEEAKKMFEKFAKSDDGTLSVESFVDGVRAAFDAEDKTFDKVLDSFLRTADGKFDDQAYKDFMQQGDAVATAYWGPRRAAERQAMNHRH